jgi:ribosomal protein L11 methyltransferase
LPERPRVLDVGTGTGVLALAAIALARATVVAFDLDPLATAAARDNAKNNDLAHALHLFTGPLDAVRDVRFDLVVANLLKIEMLPLAEGIAAATAIGGRLVLSGLLARDAEAVAPVFESAGFARMDELGSADVNGDAWVALLMRR